MRFASGTYTLNVDPSCFPHFGQVLEQLKVGGTKATTFIKALYRLTTEIGRGADIPDLEALADRRDDYAITIHGYRTALRVLEAERTVTLMDIDNA